MQDQLKRILDLVRKTGDTMVVTDTNGQETYVVMNLSRYEVLLEKRTSEQPTIQQKQQIQPIQPQKSADEWQIPDEFIIDDPEGGLADEPLALGLRPQTSDEALTKTVSAGSNIPSDLDIWSTMQSANESGPTWDISKMSQEEMKDFERKYREFTSKTAEITIEDTKIDHSVPVANSQSSATSRPDDDFSEEQFYLEPIE